MTWASVPGIARKCKLSAVTVQVTSWGVAVGLGVDGGGDGLGEGVTIAARLAAGVIEQARASNGKRKSIFLFMGMC